jgi:hypothetical protein
MVLALAAWGCEQPSAPRPASPPATTRSPAEAKAAAARVGRRVDSERPNVVILQGRESKLEVELWQDGRQLPRQDGAYRLAPRAFTLRLRGDVGHVSYVATTRPEKTSPLEQVDRPLVFFSGTGGVWPGDALALMRKEELSIHFADATFFHEQWIARPARAEMLAGFLRDTLGQTPAIATFRHHSLGFAGRTTASGGSLEEQSPLGSGEAQADFRIQSIGQAPVGQKPCVRLVLFLHSPIGQTFSQVAWARFDLRFGQDAARTQPTEAAQAP